MSKLQNPALLIFKRNLRIYYRDKSYQMDQIFPFITWMLLYTGKHTGNVGLLITSQYFLSLSLLSVTRGITVNLIDERSSRQREIQKIMGVTQSNYVLGWLITNLTRLVFVLIPFLVLTTTTKTLSDEHQGNVILAFTLFGMAQLSLAYFISVFFEDPRSGGDASMMTSIAGSFLVQLLQLSYFDDSPWPTYVISIFPSFAYGAINFSQIQMEEHSNKAGGFTFGNVYAYLMLGADTIVFLLSFIYFDQVVSNEFGTRRNPLFIFGIGKKKSSVSMTNSFIDLETYNQPLNSSFEQADYSSAVYHEPFDNERCRRSVQIDGLYKSFKGVQAVNGISLNLYENQILTLLGHNGAGKTTTISLLTGLIEKDQGKIRFYGQSIDENLKNVRKFTGICPQQDVCYDHLTVEEHLKFFARIKGIPEDLIETEVDIILSKCQLLPECKKFAKDLSGGNKRKLCLGMAIIGGSKVIFLDEPTTGVDPVSRRNIWQILQSLKQEGKSLVLSTHHLDEAEVLSERIAVMAKGKLLTVGSSDFIKKNFGIGYHLNIFNNGYSDQIWKERVFELKELVLTSIRESRFNAQSALNTLNFQLPFSEKQSFVPVFAELEMDSKISIDLYMNTLEEAYINIGLDEERFMRETGKFSTTSCQGDDPFEHQKYKQTDLHDFSSIVPPIGIAQAPVYSFTSQFSACFLRRIYLMKCKRLAFQLIIPIMLILLGCAVTLSKRDNSNPHWVLNSTATVATALIIAMSMQSCSGAIVPILERQFQLSQQMKNMGCKLLPYWLANFGFDFSISIIILLITISLVFAFAIYPLQNGGSLLIVASSFPSFITQGYLISLGFRNYVNASKFLILVMIFGTFAIPMILFLSYSLTPLRYVLIIVFPSMSTMTGLLINTDQQFKYLSLDYWVYAGILLLQGLFFFTLTILIEHGVFRRNNGARKSKSSARLDEDVDLEEQGVTNLLCKEWVNAIQLTKTYPNGVEAVRGISFVVEAGQILGILGPNGAGKTTSFNMISGRSLPTSGGVLLMGKLAATQIETVAKDIGICPQFDCLWNDMLPTQHLKIFAMIKGMKGEEIDDSVDYFIKVLQLIPYMNTPCDKLSGGNKRKLCVATALIGGTKMQFFDEPSSGVDPIARRFLWNTIQKGLRLQKGAAVLTTHMMDEAESLCHKIAIQVNGRFACIGTPQNLKQKYGSGYRATLLLNDLDAKQTVLELVEREYPTIQLQSEQLADRITFKIPSADFSFSQSFGFFLNELMGRQQLIRDFQINQSSLESVFIYFASQQVPAGQRISMSKHGSDGNGLIEALVSGNNE